MSKESLVICPVYNEENTIEQFFKKLRKEYIQDVLFIDDGSTDKSKDFFLRQRNDRTFLLQHPERHGYGASLISGFRFSHKNGYEKILTIDVDFQHNPERIPQFLQELNEYEVILGSRYIRIDRYLHVPRTRLLINRYIARLINLLFSVNFSDPFCGFRGYRRSFLEKVNLEETSYGLAIEILLEVIRTKAFFKEIPVEVIYNNHSRKFLDGLDDPRRRLLHYLEVIACKREKTIQGRENF